LFNILGCPEDQQIKLAEIIAFFKAAIERRRLHKLQELQMQMQQQQGQGQGQGGHGGHSGGGATSPLRNSRSPRPGDDWWGTTAAAATTGQLRGGHMQGAGGMDPAGYDSHEE
jgi:hypothetical protein